MQNRQHKGPPGYSSEELTACELNVTIRTLRKWRQLQVGPPWTEVGRQIFYNDASRAAWLKAKEVRPARESQLETVTA